MKLPLSVLMYRLSGDYGYETVNVDISSEYEGIKLFDPENPTMADHKYLYLIESSLLEQKHLDFMTAQSLTSAVFICLCSDNSSAVRTKSAVCTNCRDLSVVYLYAKVSFAYIFNRIQNIMKRFEEWEKSFHLSILKNSTMQDLVDITEELMTHPLIILDNNYTLLGHTRNLEEVGPAIRTIIDTGYASPTQMMRLVEDGIVSDPDTMDSSEICCYRLPKAEVVERGLDRNTFFSITYRFQVSGRVAGYAIAFHCLSEPTRGYLYLMNMIAEKLQLFFEKGKHEERIAEEKYQTFLCSILSNPDMTWRQISEQAGHIPKMHAESSFLLAQMRYNQTEAASYSFISWSLHNAMPQFMPFVYRDSFYILKDCSRTETDSKEADHRDEKEKKAYIFLSDKEEEPFEKLFQNIDYSCGISEPFFSLKKLSIAAVQCREALSIGKSPLWHEEQIRIFPSAKNTADASRGRSAGSGRERQNGTFYRYEDISFLYMMTQLRKVMPLENMESPYFTLLHAYDTEKGTDLCSVMVHFILNGCSITRTAAATYMHRNTILNKIKKATEIMGNSLDHFTLQLFFLMSFMNQAERTLGGEH